MKKLGVQPLHCLLKKREVWSSLKTKSIKKVGIEGEIRNEVTIPNAHVELESQKDEESRKWELHRTTMSSPDVRNGIAKADKLIKQKVIAASLGCIIGFGVRHESCDVINSPLNSCIILQSPYKYLQPKFL